MESFQAVFSIPAFSGTMKAGKADRQGGVGAAVPGHSGRSKRDLVQVPWGADIQQSWLEPGMVWFLFPRDRLEP